MKRISIKVVDIGTEDDVIDVEAATWPDTLVASFLRALADEISPQATSPMTQPPTYREVPYSVPINPLFPGRPTITCQSSVTS